MHLPRLHSFYPDLWRPPIQHSVFCLAPIYDPCPHHFHISYTPSYSFKVKMTYTSSEESHYILLCGGCETMKRLIEAPPWYRVEERAGRPPSEESHSAAPPTWRILSLTLSSQRFRNVCSAAHMKQYVELHLLSNHTRPGVGGSLPSFFLSYVGLGFILAGPPHLNNEGPARACVDAQAF